MNVHLVLLFLHVLSIAIWVGGMFFAYACLRPAAMLLEPPQRLPLMHAALGRFFKTVLVVVIVVLVSGLCMMARVGFADAPKGWQWMMTSGIVMMLIFGHVYAACWRRLGRAVAASDWAAGGVALNSIRRLVGISLILGVLTIAFATIGSPF